MPSVPRYTRTVEEQTSPRVRVDTTQSLEAFGGGQGLNNTIGAAQGLLKQSSDIFAEQKKKADSLVNQESDASLHKLKTDVEIKGKNMLGKDALKSEELLDTVWRKGLGELESKLSNDEQRIEFRKKAAAYEAQLYGDLKSHSAQQIRQYDDNLTKSSVENYRNDAISNFKDPSKIQVSLMQQEKAMREYGERHGISDEDMKNNLDEARSKTHAGVIIRMLNTGDDMLAGKYFKNISEQMVGADKSSIEKLLEEGSFRGEAQRRSDMILNENLPMTDALAKAREIEDPKLRDEVSQRVKQRFVDKKMAENQDIEALHKRGADYLDKNPDIDQYQNENPIDWARFSVGERESLRAYAKKRRAGEDVGTDWAEYYNLKTMAAEPATRDKFKQTNLYAMKNKLADAEFKEMVSLQTDLRKGSGKSDKLLNGYRTASMIVNDSMRAAGIDPSPKEGSKDATSVAMLRAKIDQQVVTLQQQTGKEATNEDVQRITDNMLVQVITDKGILWDTKKRNFELSPTETGTIDIKDVPTLEKDKITKALMKNKIPVTDDNILKLYTRKLQQK